MRNKDKSTPEGPAFGRAIANQPMGGGKAAVRPAKAIVQRKLTTYEDIEQSAKKDKFSWQKLRTDTDNYDEKKAAAAEGLGVKAAVSGKNFKTDIKWKPVDGSSGEGTEVEANLGPDHKLGTPPAGGVTKHWNKRVQLMKKISGQTYIAGHLLNNNLGGPGDDVRNLTAIPATINSSQSVNVEEVIKKKVNEDYQFFYYKVAVTYSSDGSAKAQAANKKQPVSYASKITMSWSPIDADKNQKPGGDSVAITIPDPTSYDKDGTYNAHLRKIAPNDGDKAEVDPAKEVVLNNSGFLGIATKTTAVIRTKMEELRAKYEVALKDLAVLKKGGEDNKEKIKDLMEEVEGFREENKELTEQNKKLMAEIAALKDTSAEQEVKIQELNALLEEERKKVRDLQTEISERDAEIERLQGVIDELNKAYADLKRKRRESHERHELESEVLSESHRKLVEKVRALEYQLQEIERKFHLPVADENEQEEAQAEPEEEGANPVEAEGPRLTGEQQEHLDDILDKDLPFRTYKGLYLKQTLFDLYKLILPRSPEEINGINMNLMWKRIRARYAS